MGAQLKSEMLQLLRMKEDKEAE